MRFGNCSLVSFLVCLTWLAGCGGGTPKAVQTVTTTPTTSNNQLPTLQLTASPASISAGGFSTLTWNTSGASSVSFNPSLGEDDAALPVGGSMAVAPQTTTTYTETASGPGGKVSQSVTINVGPPLPTISIIANPSSLVAGSQSSSTLSWTTQNATSASIDGIGSISVPSGSISVSPSTTTTYTANVSGAGGHAAASVNVIVSAISMVANPGAVAPGQSATLSWNAPSAKSITIDHGIGTVTVPSGAVAVSPASTTRYTATVIDGNGNTSTGTALLVVSPAGSGFLKIKHIIFFVQENRSFDNYFGKLGEYRAAHGISGSFDGIPAGAALPDPEGQFVSSYHFQTECHQNTQPGWAWAWRDYDGGKMDGFVISAANPQNAIDPHGTRAMGYYDSTDLPYYYDLATQFATSDRFFSSILGSTIPNRMYLFAATSFGNVSPPNTAAIAQWSQPTIFDMLDKANISWRYYYQDSSVFLAQWATWLKDSGKVWSISHWATDVANQSTLPQVIFIERATQIGLDEHPGSNVQKGAASTQKLIQTLMNSPSWASSVFILTYDEAGGLYDHVPPVSLPAPDDIAPPTSYGDFKHSGFRVPLVVVSPWIKPHFVSHVPRDLTSILKLIETRFGVQSLTARDAAADDMTEFFDFGSPAWLTPPTLATQPTNGACNMNL